MLHICLGLDISKSSPGWSVIKCMSGTIISVKTGVFDIPASKLITKEYWEYCTLLEKEIEKKLDQILTEDYSNLENISYIHVCLESNVFHHQFSELLFCINQSVLKAIKSKDVNCVGLPPSRLKMLIKSLTEKKAPKKLTKAGVEKIYKECVWGKSKTKVFPNPKDIKTDDEFDALFLALFGLVLFSKSLTLTNTNKIEDPEYIKNNILLANDFLHNKMLDNLQLELLEFPEKTENKSIHSIIKGKDFAPLKTASKNLYPFTFEKYLWAALSISTPEDIKKLSKELSIPVKVLKDRETLFNYLRDSKVTQMSNGKFTLI